MLLNTMMKQQTSSEFAASRLYIANSSFSSRFWLLQNFLLCSSSSMKNCLQTDDRDASQQRLTFIQYFLFIISTNEVMALPVCIGLIVCLVVSRIMQKVQVWRRSEGFYGGISFLSIYFKSKRPISQFGSNPDTCLNLLFHKTNEAFQQLGWSRISPQKRLVNSGNIKLEQNTFWPVWPQQRYEL